MRPNLAKTKHQQEDEIGSLKPLQKEQLQGELNGLSIGPLVADDTSIKQTSNYLKTS